MPIDDKDTVTATLFADDAQRFLNGLEAKYSTHLSYENILNRYWLPMLGHRITQEITSDHMREVLAGFQISQKTKRNALTVARGVFDHAQVSPKPAQVKLKKQQKAKIQRFLPAERDMLLGELAKAGHQVAAYFALFFGTRMRPGEMRGLAWPDYDGEYIRVHQQIVRRRRVIDQDLHGQAGVCAYLGSAVSGRLADSI